MEYALTPATGQKRKRKMRRKGKFKTCIHCRLGRVWSGGVARWFSLVADAGDYSAEEAAAAMSGVQTSFVITS